ncbi:flavodoxin family protein [Cupriavidus sp. 2TAF22]|uniref:flavodoxin family protein n=1 Tax=unclassified Cupriavidus TaxID=2640874 RepID=UPI003F90CCC8
MEKILIVYYSRTGTSRQAAEELAAHTGWPIAEVGDQVSRAGLLGDARCVLDVLLQRHVGYRYAGPSLDEYQQIVIVAPVWVGHLAAPMRSFLRDRLPLTCKTSVVCVMARQGGFNAAEEVARLASEAPSPVIALRQSNVASGAALQALRAFAAQVEAASARADTAQRPAWLSPKEA